jgi:hypothetical protein
MRVPRCANPRAPQVQAYLSILVGGLLAFNVIWPTDEPSIPRLIVSRTLLCVSPLLWV